MEMALQAQTNHLKQQQKEFENIIGTYSGDDPLENYYNYISWVEQSYPNHRHEGNLVSLLEHCLLLFEYDKRYTNDRRFCKLWIKYFDLKPNPLELYHMMKDRGLCQSCADFYKAWAYYYEVAGNFQAANEVFEDGKRNLAQPYEDLVVAHKNLISAIGLHHLFGPDESKLFEKRQVLTALHTYRSGCSVSSIRTPTSNGLVTVPPTIGNPDTVARDKAMVFVYEDKGMAVNGAVSIVSVARMKKASKENQLKPGQSTATKLDPTFTVLEDFGVPAGIKLSRNHPTECLKDYSNCRVPIRYPELPNPARIPMYSKKCVSIDPNTEYSIDELGSRRYLQCVATARRLPKVQQGILECVEDIGNSLDDEGLSARNVHPEQQHQLQYVQQSIPIYQESPQNCNSRPTAAQRSFINSCDSGSGPSVVIPPQIQSKEPIVARAEPKKYVVEKIIDSRINDDGVKEYFLKRIGHEEKDNSREPVQNLDCPGLIKAFKMVTVRKNKDGESTKEKSYDKRSPGFERGLVPEKSIGDTDRAEPIVAPAEPKKYVVEKIIDSRINDDGVKEYFLKRVGHEEKDNSREPVQNLDCPELIKALEMERARRNKDGESTKKKSDDKSLPGCSRELEPEKSIGDTGRADEVPAEIVERNLLTASENKFQCTKCFKRYKHAHVMRRHMEFECGVDRKFGCAICGHKSKREDAMLVHMHRKHKL